MDVDTSIIEFVKRLLIDNPSLKIVYAYREQMQDSGMERLQCLEAFFKSPSHARRCKRHVLLETVYKEQQWKNCAMDRKITIVSN